MLDNNILHLVENRVIGIIDQSKDIPSESKAEVINVTTSTILNGFIANFTQNNMSSMSGIFGVNGSDDMNETLISYVTYALNDKFGIDNKIANNIASSVVPTVTDFLLNKFNKTDQPGFSEESLLEAFSGQKGDKKDSDLLD